MYVRIPYTEVLTKYNMDIWNSRHFYYIHKSESQHITVKVGGLESLSP